MIDIVLVFIALMSFFVVMGTFEKFWAIKWASYSLAFLEMVFMCGIVYVNEAGGSILNLLRVNFYTMALVGFGLLAFKMFMVSVLIAAPEQENEQSSDKWIKSSDTNRWGNDR